MVYLLTEAGLVMKFKKLLGIAADVAGTANPLVGAGINLINKFLPKDKQLPSTASNGEVLSAAEKLSSEDQAALWDKELDVEIKEIESHTEIMKALAEADASGSSTRPNIAYMMAWVLAISITPVAGEFAYAMVVENSIIMKSITENYMVLLALLSGPTTLLYKYFGARTEEKKSRYAMAKNQPVQNTGLIGSILGAMSKRGR